MVPGRGRLRAAALTTLTVLLVLVAGSGCSGSGTPEAGPGTASSGSSPSVAASPSESAQATPASEPSVPPAPEPPKGRTGPAGQEAFARFVMDAWSWSLRTNDATPLLDASLSRKDGCDGCASLAKELRGRAKEGWYVDFPGLDIHRTKLRRTGDTAVATSTVSIPESNSYEDDGSYRSTSPAHQDATFTVTMRVTRSGCRLVSFRVG